MKYYLLFILVCFRLTLAFSQSTYELELRGGIIYFDSKVANGDYSKSRQGWASQSDLTLFRSFDIKRKIKPLLGIGYTNLYYWNVILFTPTSKVNYYPYHSTLYGNPTSHYLNIKYGFATHVYKRKLEMQLSMCNYILLHKELQAINQRRMFLNVDILIKYKINDRFSLTLSTPFTIHPIVQDFRERIISNTQNPIYDRFVEMNGGLLGLRYCF